MAAVSYHVVSVFLHVLIRSIVAKDWGYSNTDQAGPNSWLNDYIPCGGVMQSPVDVKTHELVYDPKLTAGLSMQGYASGIPSGEWTMANTGHSVLVSIPRGVTIQGAGLDGTFEASQFHFHWGATNDRGSEHTIDGHQYSMELHIVHYNTKYKSIDIAADKVDGLAVLGVFVEVGSHNPGFQDVTNDLSKIRHAGNKTTINPLTLRDMLPRCLRNLYRYDGSLTTPPCYESIQWTVFGEAVRISQKQMDAFRAVHFADGQPMADNYRPVQPVGKRVIYSSERETDFDQSDGASWGVWVIVACIATVSFFLGRISLPTAHKRD